MPSYIGKNRKIQKEKERKQDEIEQEHAIVSDSVGSDPVGVGDQKAHEEDGRGKSDERRSGDGSVGGFVEVDRREAERDLQRQERNRKQSEVRIQTLNQYAEYFLSCLEPEANQNFHIAAFDAKVRDIGIYILGVLNRLHKMGDYFEPDIEFEWEQGVVGYDEDLYCEYCHKKISNPTNLRQRFCDNKCARDYRLHGTTGVIFPSEVQRGPTIEEMEEKAWEREQKRLGSRS